MYAIHDKVAYKTAAMASDEVVDGIKMGHSPVEALHEGGVGSLLAPINGHVEEFGIFGIFENFGMLGGLGGGLDNGLGSGGLKGGTFDIGDCSSLAEVSVVTVGTGVSVAVGGVVSHCRCCQ